MRKKDTKKYIDDFNQKLDRIEANKKRQEDRTKSTELKKLIAGVNSYQQITSKKQSRVNVLLKKLIKKFDKRKPPIVNVSPPKVIVKPKTPRVKVTVPDVIVPEIKIPPANVDVNIPDEMKIKKPSWLGKLYDNRLFGILSALLNQLKGFSWPTEPSNAIPVRLSDGNKFYKAVAGAVSKISGSMGVYAYKNKAGNAQVEMESDGSVPVAIKSGGTIGGATEAKQDDIISELSDLFTELLGKLEAGESIDVGNFPVDFPDSAVLVELQNKATSAKQLPNNHDVTVSNPTADPETGLAKESKQLADNHWVAVSNPTTDPETGLAKESKQLANDHDVNVSNQISGFATSAKQDTLLARTVYQYEYMGKQSSGNYEYFGFKENGGTHWKIMRKDITDDSNWQYAYDSAGWVTAWVNPVILSYNDPPN